MTTPQENFPVISLMLIIINETDVHSMYKLLRESKASKMIIFEYRLLDPPYELSVGRSLSFPSCYDQAAFESLPRAHYSMPGCMRTYAGSDEHSN